jgi:hypothetical protein
VGKRVLFLTGPFTLSAVTLYFLQFFNVQILLYEKILLATLLGITFQLIVHYYTNRNNLKLVLNFEFLVSILLSSIIFYSFCFSTILNVDRSKSLYVLLWVHDLGPVSEIELANKISLKYGVFDRDTYEQRIEEQIQRGLISTSAGNLNLTQKGNLIYESANLLAHLFKLAGWNKAKL